MRSKRTLGWRTCLIIPELEHELDVAQNERLLASEVSKLRRLQNNLDDHIDLLRQKILMGLDVHQQLSSAEAKAVELKTRLRLMTDLYNSKFNSNWGQLLKAGHQDSRFAKQVLDYACLYTSRASNLGLIYPNRSFRPVQDFMPHDQLLFNTEDCIIFDEEEIAKMTEN